MSVPPVSVPDLLRDKRIAIVDIEGNGHDEIVEIAVLSLDSPVVDPVDLRHWLVRPPRPISPLVTRKVHGIRDSDVAHCPVWETISPTVDSIMNDRILVAHNASVEHRVLSAHLPHWRPLSVLDTLRLAKTVWPGLPRYGLSDLIKHADLDNKAVHGHGHHRADYDTLATARLLCRLAGDSEFDWDTLVCTAALPKFLPSPHAPEGLW